MAHSFEHDDHVPKIMVADTNASPERNPRFHGMGYDHCGVKCTMLHARPGTGSMHGNAVDYGSAPMVNALSGPGAKHKAGYWANSNSERATYPLSRDNSDGAKDLHGAKLLGTPKNIDRHL